MKTNIKTIDKGLNILCEDGTKVFIKSTLKYIIPIIQLRHCKYKIQYGSAAPLITDIIKLPTEEVQYGFPSSECPYQMLSFGIMSGDWDYYKQPIEDSFITEGLKQRFVKRLNWEDTVYYETAIKYFNNNKQFTPLNSYRQSEEGLMHYFEDLDDLFCDLKNNGFKKIENIPHEQLPKVHISRNGEFILTHGHHRTIMCKILGINIIPARIGVRHTKWQLKRAKILKSTESQSNHPDLIK